MNIKQGFLIGFFITVVLIAYNDITKCKQLPWPPRIIFAGVTFALIDMFSIISEELAALMALGIVVAALVQKGFVSDCSNNKTTGTVQTASFSPITPNQATTTTPQTPPANNATLA